MTPLEEYQIEDIENTFRLISNMIDAPQRDTCLKRDVMKCWNWVYDALHDVPHDETVDNGIKYRMRVGQTPYNNKKNK